MTTMPTSRVNRLCDYLPIGQLLTFGKLIARRTCTSHDKSTSFITSNKLNAVNLASMYVGVYTLKTNL
jgi:hypothetical protein